MTKHIKMHLFICDLDTDLSHWNYYEYEWVRSCSINNVWREREEKKRREKKPRLSIFQEKHLEKEKEKKLVIFQEKHKLSPLKVEPKDESHTALQGLLQIHQQYQD